MLVSESLDFTRLSFDVGSSKKSLRGTWTQRSNASSDDFGAARSHSLSDEHADTDADMRTIVKSSFMRPNT